MTMRRIGSMIRKLADEQQITHAQLAKELNMDECYIHSLLKGRVFLSGLQLEKLCDLFKIDPEKFLNGDDAYYSENVVHCITPFTNEDNREKILDLIDTYIDVYLAATAE